MTHRDEINNMSNEELAEFLTIEIVNILKNSRTKHYKLDDTHIQGCIKDVTEWLNTEVEE